MGPCPPRRSLASLLAYGLTCALLSGAVRASPGPTVIAPVHSIPAPRDRRYPGQIHLAVDASDVLRRVEHVRHFDAIAISAGNLTLLNLVLRGAVFEHAVMLAPVTSLRSLYRCPAGVNRVQQISRSYRFTPASGCPGDAEQDQAFQRGTTGYDPAAINVFSPEQMRVLRATRWMSVYEDGDPKVPPQENILTWKRNLQRHGIQIVTRIVVDAHTHTGPGLLPECMGGLLAFLRDDPGRK